MLKRRAMIKASIRGGMFSVPKRANPHFSCILEKCAQGADPAAAGSGLAAKAFVPAGRFPTGLLRVDFAQSEKFCEKSGLTTCRRAAGSTRFAHFSRDVKNAGQT